MSRGRIYRPTYTKDGRKHEARVWWADFSVNGERYRESTKTTEVTKAQKFLTRRLRELDVFGPQERDYGEVEFEELAELIREDYKRNNRSSVENRLAHLEAFFEGHRVLRIGDAQVRAYISKREKEGAANATINRELSALRRMFNLGEKANLVAPGRAPDVSDHMLTENNVRTGFVSEAELQKLLTKLPPRLQPLAEVAFVTGWRKAELLSRNWEHVDFSHGWLRLEPGETKSGKGRQFPLTADLRAVLEAQRQRKEEVEREYGREVEAVFFYYEASKNGMPAGRRIKTFRRAWKTATKAAGLKGLVFHDLRRSAVRQMVRAGVSEKIAQEYTGHQTREIFRRYDIVSEQDLREQAAKLEAHREAAKRAINGKETAKIS